MRCSLEGWKWDFFNGPLTNVNEGLMWMTITFSRHSSPMDLGSTRTSKTTELGWLIKHHILHCFSVYQEMNSRELAVRSLAETTDHLMNSQCSIKFTADRLLYKPFAHFTTMSILCNSLDRIKSNSPFDNVL